MTRNILRLITRLNIGGPSIQALLLSRELSDDYPTVLAAGHAPKLEGEMSDPRVPVVHVPLVRPIRPHRDLEALARVRNLVVRSRVGLVHTHMAKAGMIGRSATFSVRRRIRTVHTFHGHVLEGYFRPLVERALVRIERALAKRTDVLIAVSDEVRDDLLHLGIGKPEQWRVMKLGFDLAPFLAVGGPTGALRADLGVDEQVPLVGAIGRFAPVKDHLMLLDAIARVNGAHVVLVGDGEMRGLLEDRAQRSDVRGRVHFVGWRRDVAAVLADLDVVALTSVNEGTPVSLIEALAAGRPVVATDVGGVRAVVDEGSTGMLVPRDGPELFAVALERLLNDKPLRDRMGAEGRKRMPERFSKDRLVAEIRALYDELLSG